MLLNELIFYYVQSNRGAGQRRGRRSRREQGITQKADLLLLYISLALPDAPSGLLKYIYIK